MTDPAPIARTALIRALPLFLFTILMSFAAEPGDGAKKIFDLPPDSAERSIRRFSEQSGLQVLYPSSAVEGVRTPAVRGEMTAREALDAMVAGTRLIVVRDEQTGAFSIKRGDLPNGKAVHSDSAVSEHQSRGGISGNVSNAGTGNLLEGAKVNLPQLGLSAFTDNTGRFVFNGVPAGNYEIVASYLGLDAKKNQVVVAPGERAARNFDLTAGIYKLQAFTVSGQREGTAAALTAQRNAPNVKNVVALDAFGNLPNMNAGELAILLPGVAGNVDDEGNVNGFTIRGMGPGLNTITIDGALMSGEGGIGRTTRLKTITGAMFDQLELTKGHTPDKGMDSLGGTINLRSRSPLSMKEKRRVTYNFSGRLAPPGTEQIPLREAHRFHPLLNGAYQEVFDVLGAERNLGVALNVFYSEQVVGNFGTTRDFQNTTSQPAYLYDYGTEDNYNNRKQSSVNAKFDFRLSPNTKISLNTIYNDAFERFRLRYNFRAFTGNNSAVPNATTSGIVPGFTSRITEVRPVAASTIDITSRMSQFFNRMRQVDLGAEHEFGPLQIDYKAVRSTTHISFAGGDGGVLVNRVTGVGWILDRTQSDLYPRFIQTAGPDIRNPASYRPASYTFVEGDNNHEIADFFGNVRYKLPTTIPLFIKAGARWRQETAADESKNRRYNFLGANSSQLPTDPTIETFGNHKTGLVTPQWNANAIGRGHSPIDRSLWGEDIYYAEMSKYTGTRSVTEKVTAGYVMAQGAVGHTGFLAGVRTEKTEDESWGWVRARIASTAAQQMTDPVGAANRDYANTRRDISGSYTKSFPSAHLTHDITSNLKARLSWSTSFGRPPLSNLLPNETVSEAAQTLTINNPGLRPQSSKNWDVDLAYYFEPVGSLSIGWFHKQITDYFVTGVRTGTVGGGSDNGYNGEYGGFAILTRGNLGTAFVQGWEINYQHQFTFLPGLLQGLGLSVNTTLLDTHGNFGTAVTRSSGEVAGFIPRTDNVSLTWRHRGFGARVTANRTSNFLRTFSATGSGANLFVRERTVVNAGVAYQFRPWLSVSVDVANLFNEKQSWYRGNPDQTYQVYINGTTVTFGVSGRF